MEKPAKLAVEVLGVRVGALTQSSHRPAHVFTYLPDTPSTHFVSLAMPVRPESYDWPEGLHPVFQMNLPEGHQMALLRKNLGPAMPVDDFALLALTGARGIGRVSVYPWEQERPDINPVAVADILARPDSRAALLDALDKSTFNISGVMPKVPSTAPANDSTSPLGERLTVRTDDWIAKTGSDDTPGIAINEFLCLQLAEEMGLPVPKRVLSNDGQVLAIARFDRDYEHGGVSLGLEDFCALMGMPPHDKYNATMEGIAKNLLIWCAQSERVTSAKRLIEMVVLNLVVRNADAHAKNYAVLYSSPGDATLAPVYDVVTVTAFPAFLNSPFALSIGGRKNWNLRKELERLSVERLNLPESTVGHALEKAAAGMQRILPEASRYTREYPAFRQTGKRMIRCWEEGLTATSDKKGISTLVSLAAPKFSPPKKKRKARKAPHTMNPEKFR